MGVDVFGNSGMDTQNIGQPQTPQGGSVPSGNTSNPIVDALIQKLNQTQQMQKQVILPQQLPPNHVQPGDVSGNFVNPSTSGGPAHNARVSLAQSIGGAVSQAINRHEDKEARDLSFDIQIMQTSMNTLNDPNASPQDKALAQQQLNDLTSDKGKMKKIQKALNIQFFGGEDKRTNVEKQAVQMATQATQQGQQKQPMSETGGLPQGMGPQGMPGLNPMAQQLMRRLPSMMGMTPEAEAQMAQTKAGVIPSAKDQMQYAVEVMQNDTKMQEVIAKVGIERAKMMITAQINQDKNLTAQQRTEMLGKIAQAKDETMLKTASMRAGAEIQSANIRANAATAIAAGKNSLTDKIDTLKLQKATITDQSKAITQQLKDNTAVLDSKNSSKSAKIEAGQKISELEARQKELNQQLDVLGTQLDTTQKQSTALDSLGEGTTFDDIWGDASGGSDEQ